MIAPLAELASMSVLLRLSLPAIFTKLIQIFVQTVVLVPTFVLLEQLLKNSLNE